MFQRWLANGSLGQVPVIIMGVFGAAVARCELATIERFDVRILWDERRDIVAAKSDNGRAIFEAYWPVETVVIAIPIAVEWKEAGRRKNQRVHTRADRCAIRIGFAETSVVSEEIVVIFLGEFHTLVLVSISGTSRRTPRPPAVKTHTSNRASEPSLSMHRQCRGAVPNKTA